MFRSLAFFWSLDSDQISVVGLFILEDYSKIVAWTGRTFLSKDVINMEQYVISVAMAASYNCPMFTNGEMTQKKVNATTWLLFK